MLSKKTIKKISIIIGIALIVLWFGGNLGFYIYLKSIFDNEHEKALNKIPEKLTLTESNLNAESIYITDFKLKFPFYKEDIVNVFPLFWENELNSIMLTIRKKEKVFVVDFHTLPYIRIDEPLLNKVKTLIIYGDGYFWESLEEIYYARLTDYSWWNLRHNMRLSALLLLKSVALPNYTDYQVYDLKTPFLKGFLIESKSEYRKGTITQTAQTVDFQFVLKDKKHSITFISIDEETVNLARDILTTIHPIDNIEEGYKEMEVLFKGKERSSYPKELLFLSMISLEGATVDNLEELMKIMEDRKYKKSRIDLIRMQIEYLKN